MASDPFPIADMTFPQEASAAPTVPQPPALPAIAAPQGPVTARQMLDAAKAYRDALGDQYDRLRSQRGEVARAAREENRNSTDVAGLETRLKAMDERLLNLEKQISVADARVAEASALPGAVVKEPPRQRDNRPDWDTVMGIGSVLTFAFVFPVVIAYSRRIWRRSAKVTVTLPPEVADRMQAMEEAIESVAVEVERIGEGQRFMTQALSESPRFVGAGAAEPIMVRAREAANAERPL